VIDETNNITYACGFSESTIYGVQPTLTAFTTSSGEIINTTVYGTGFNGIFESIILYNGFLYCVGYVQSSNILYNAVIVKFNQFGGVVWQRGFTTSSNKITAFTGIVHNGELGTDYIYVTGYSTDTNSRMDGILVKFDTEGNKVWQQRSYNDVTENTLFNDVDVINGEIIISGLTGENGFLSKIVNLTGALVDTHIITNNDSEVSVEYHDTYVDATHYYSVGNTGSSSMIHKIERTTGNVEWSKIIDSSKIKSITTRNSNTELIVVGSAVSIDNNGAIHYLSPTTGEFLRDSHLIYHTDGGTKIIEYNSVYISSADDIHAFGTANNTDAVKTDSAYFKAEDAGLNIVGAGLTLPQYVIKKELLTISNDDVVSSSISLTQFDDTDLFFIQVTLSFLTNAITFINNSTLFLPVAISPTPTPTVTPTPSNS